MPASYFQAANPLFILLLGPLFAAAWLWLDRSRFAPSGVVKQGIGMIVLGLGFVVLAIADAHAGAVDRVSPLWLLAVYLLNTMGELCLSPIGLSLVTKLAPAQLASLLMGVWFTAMGLANYFAGTLEALLAGTGIPLYWFLVGSSIGAGLVLLLISPLLNRWMHGIK
jgi:POT family proton-dependent oligopeptide transporter